MENLIIYLIDDDEIVNFINREVIIFSNITDKILSFQKAEDALLSLQNPAFIPDLILLDIKMSKMDGFEFLEIYNLKYPNLMGKIAILSASQNESDKKKAKELGVQHFLNKPLTENSFRSLFA